MTPDTIGAVAVFALAGACIAWAATAVLRRALDQAVWERHVAEAVEAADWTGTPTHDALLTEERFLPVAQAMERAFARDVEEYVRGERR